MVAPPNKYLFEYCQKLVLLNKNLDQVYLGKRQDEKDFDGTWSFIAGKMEITDADFLDGLKREKDQEVGEDFKVLVYAEVTKNIYYAKQSGTKQILPHFAAIYSGGKAVVNEEYSECRWVPINELEKLEPKVANVPEIVDWAQALLATIPLTNMEEI